MKRRNLVMCVVMLAVCLVLAACGHGVPSGVIEFDPETGNGTAAFTMVVPKNGAPDVGNNFIEPNGDDGPNNTGYIKHIVERLCNIYSILTKHSVNY